ncbi:unnamed protein product [Choristocarpus tenellus]
MMLCDGGIHPHQASTAAFLPPCQKISWELSSRLCQLPYPRLSLRPRIIAMIPSGGQMMCSGVKLKVNFEADVGMPSLAKSLLWGPWDPEGILWTRQVSMATEIIRRSSGVVFIEQLAPVLTPSRPPQPDGCSDADEAFVVPLLTELEGVQEVTEEGDILYIFPTLAGGGLDWSDGGQLDWSIGQELTEATVFQEVEESRPRGSRGKVRLGKDVLDGGKVLDGSKVRLEGWVSFSFCDSQSLLSK